MPLPPKSGSRSQPVVAQPTRDKGGMPLPPKSGCRRSMQTGDMLQSKFYITKRNQMKWKHRRFAFANLRCLSGDGEIRTLVQTWNQYAFYMLSFDLVFDRGQDQNYQPKAYLLKSRTATGEQAVPAPILLAPPYRNVSEQGNRVMSRFCHCGRNKANLLCFG